ncbi:MAG: PAS domain S-box protein, partial [Actinomycetota bacterium]|nr:PAS domain S-box protein [Actinomycetota bacterium]
MSEERLRLLVEGVKDYGIFMLDPEGHVISWNEGACRIEGYRQEEILGRHFSAFYPEEDIGRGKPEHELEVAKNEGAHEEEGWRVRQDGSRFWASVLITALRDDVGQLRGFSHVTRDVTEQREAEEALREQTETLEKVNRIGQLLSSELDLQRLVQAVTDEATELTGARFGAFFYNLVDDCGESYTLYTISGVPREAFSKFPMPRKTEVFGPTFEGERVVRSADIREDPRYGNNPPYKGMPKGHLPVVSYLAVPVVSRSGETLGGLFFGHPEVGVFGEREEQLVVGLAAQAAIAIDNARLFESMRESEDRLRLAVESTGLGTWDFNPVTGELRWDDRCKAMFGLQPEAEVDYEVFLAGLHPEDRERTDRAVQRSLDPASGGEFDVEYRTVGIEDGIERWVVARGQAFFEEAGRAVRFIGTVLDITERKKNEEALRQSERLYRAVIEQATENIFLVDVETRRIVESNPAFQETLGYTEQELKGMTLYDIVAADRESIDANVRRFLEQKDPFVGERKYRRKDGSLADIEVSASTIFRDGRETMCVVAHDVTERKKNEEAQRFLAEASATLSSSLDYRVTLARVAQLTVPYLADWCVVDILEEDDSLDRLALTHQNPEKVALARELEERYPPDPEAQRGVAQALRTGRPELVPEIPESLLDESVRDAEHRRILEELGLRSYVIVPLVARGRTLGAITLVAAESGRRYGTADLELAEELARRAALAVDNARLYRGRSEIARTLQGSLLPSRLPEVPGVEVGLSYLPAGEVD